MQQIELDQFEQNLVQLLKKALAGEEIIITQAEQPVLKLVRLSTQPIRRKRGSAKGQIQMSADFDAPLDDFQAYNESLN